MLINKYYADTFNNKKNKFKLVSMSKEVVKILLTCLNTYNAVEINQISTKSLKEVAEVLHIHCLKS